MPLALRGWEPIYIYIISGEGGGQSKWGQNQEAQT